jgi:hypothetical protein
MDRDNVMAVAMAAMVVNIGGDESWSIHGGRTIGTLILAIIVVVRVVVVGKHDCRLCRRGRSTTSTTGRTMATQRRRCRRRGATRTLVLFLGMTMPFLALAGTLVGLGESVVGLV